MRAEVECDVDAILQRRVKQGEVQYSVQWSDKSLTWEVQGNLEGAEELVTEFEDNRKETGKGTGGRGSFGADKGSGEAMRLALCVEQGAQIGRAGMRWRAGLGRWRQGCFACVSL